MEGHWNGWWAGHRQHCVSGRPRRGAGLLRLGETAAGRVEGRTRLPRGRGPHPRPARAGLDHRPPLRRPAGRAPLDDVVRELGRCRPGRERHLGGGRRPGQAAQAGAAQQAGTPGTTTETTTITTTTTEVTTTEPTTNPAVTTAGPTFAPSGPTSAPAVTAAAPAATTAQVEDGAGHADRRLPAGAAVQRDSDPVPAGSLGRHPQHRPVHRSDGHHHLGDDAEADEVAGQLAHPAQRPASASPGGRSPDGRSPS